MLSVDSAINKHDKHEMINLNGLFDCTIAYYFGSHLMRKIYKLLFNTELSDSYNLEVQSLGVKTNSRQIAIWQTYQTVKMVVCCWNSGQISVDCPVKQIPQ